MHRTLPLLLLLASCADAHVVDASLPDAGVDAGFDPDARVTCAREITVSYRTRAAQPQIAVWAQTDERFATLAITDATARRGIGNRPGAMQMNSGYRWPVGRRENVLPGWAGTRRAMGAEQFPRVIHNGAESEGVLSRPPMNEAGATHTPDDYACMSFDTSVMDRDGLDAVTCASYWRGDKGRYITDADVAAGYSEPVQASDGSGGWRALELESAYPPRSDYEASDRDHPDVARFAADARGAMPELDAVTTATPRPDVDVSHTWRVPGDWTGELTVAVEVSQEGDYAPGWDPEAYPTPTSPEGAWDYWATSYGYPYRGQPSVIFDVPIRLPPTDRRAASVEAGAAAPTRMGTVDHTLATTPVDGTIVDAPGAAPGSGADRLAAGDDGLRVRVTVAQVDCR